MSNLQMMSWQNVKLTKCWVDKMSDEQYNWLKKCQVDEMTSCQNAKLTKHKMWKLLTKWIVDVMSSWQSGKLMLR